MSKRWAVPVTFILEGTDDEEANACYDAINEILRGQRRMYSADSPLLDYHIGEAKQAPTWCAKIIEALDGWAITGRALEDMADDVLAIVGKHLPETGPE